MRRRSFVAAVLGVLCFPFSKLLPERDKLITDSMATAWVPVSPGVWWTFDYHNDRGWVLNFNSNPNLDLVRKLEYLERERSVEK